MIEAAALASLVDPPRGSDDDKPALGFGLPVSERSPETDDW